MLSDPLQFEFMRLALAEAVLMGGLCGGVGGFVVLRRLAFLADAIPHFIFPGVVMAYLLRGDLVLGGLVAALLAVAVVARLARQRGLREDAAVGVTFVGVFALGVVLVSGTRNYGQSLSELLFGNILGVTATDLVLTLGVGVVVVGALGLLYKELLLTSFDPALAAGLGLPVGRLDYALLALIALTVVVAVGAVGNTLVVGLLVTPAAAARLLARRVPALLLIGAVIGAGSGVVGLYLSYHLGLASGATIVVTAAGCFLLALLFSPRDGVLTRLVARRASPAAPAHEGGI